MNIDRLKYYYNLFNFFTSDYFGDVYSATHILPEQKFIDVHYYSIDIQLDFERKEIIANETINFFISNAIERLPFNFYENLMIDNLRLNEEIVEFTREKDHLIFHGNFEKGNYQLKLSYHGRPENIGLGSFNFAEIPEGKFLFTVNEPVFAPTWFVCNDIQVDKAKYNVSIMADSVLTSISVGNLDSITYRGKSKIFHYSTEYEIPTYSVAIYSGVFYKFKRNLTVEDNSLKTEIYLISRSKKLADKLFSTIQLAIETFQKKFGEYPFYRDKIAIVEIPWEYGGIENYSVIGIGSKYFDETLLFKDLFIHEISHCWWGNAVTPKNWKDIWLNEGFAKYSEVLFDEFNYGKNAYYSAMKNIKYINSENTLSDPGKEAIRKFTYNNGAWILHLLRKEMGDDLFMKMLKEYFQRFEYSAASTNDFEKVVKKFYGKDAEEFFRKYIYSTEIFPEIKVEIDKLGKGYDLKFILDSSESPQKIRIRLNEFNSSNYQDTTINVNDGSRIYLHSKFLSESLEFDPEADYPGVIKSEFVEHFN